MLRRGAPRLYFLHIPKTAGSSIGSWLGERVGAARTCPAVLWNEIVSAPDGRLHGYRLFRGHFGWDLDAYVGRRLHRVTVFRDPLERTISHYRHVRRDPLHPRHRTVARQDFAAFVADTDNWPMIENFQARYLMPNVVDPARLRGRLDPAPAKLNLLSTVSEDARYLYDREHVRDVAFRRLERLDVVGVASDILGFLSRVCARFGLGDPPMLAPRTNVAPAGDAAVTADDATRATVRALTEIDQRLHDRALAAGGGGVARPVSGGQAPRAPVTIAPM